MAIENEKENVIDLLGGEWRGESSVIDVDGRKRTELSYGGKVVEGTGKQFTAHYEVSSGQNFAFEGERLSDRFIQFKNGYQLRDLGGGVTVLTPAFIPSQGNFFVEMGWLLGNRRTRIVRTYEGGMWKSTAFHVERKV